MTARPVSLALVALLAAHGLASAQPAPAPTPAPMPANGDKVDAKSLMQSGVRLLQAKDYLGALAVFKTAYQRFASAKILLNIGTTLKLLGRDADAANAYQYFLDSKDTDPARRDEVVAAVAELDKNVARLKIAITPADSEIQVGDDDWVPAAAAATWRVAAGAIKVHARHAGYVSGETTVTGTVGTDTAVAIKLELVPPPVAIRHNDFDNDIHEEAPWVARSRFGVIASTHVDPFHSGIAGLVGLTLDATERLEVQGEALLGASSGAYVGAGFALLTGRTRVVVSAGMPVVFYGGARYSVRGALGIQYELNRHLTLVVEAGVEHILNPTAPYIDPITMIPHAIAATAFIPAASIVARI